jgi:hypothetical protein
MSGFFGQKHTRSRFRTSLQNKNEITMEAARDWLQANYIVICCWPATPSSQKREAFSRLPRIDSQAARREIDVEQLSWANANRSSSACGRSASVNCNCCQKCLWCKSASSSSLRRVLSLCKRRWLSVGGGGQERRCWVFESKPLRSSCNFQRRLHH